MLNFKLVSKAQAFDSLVDAVSVRLQIAML